MSTLFQVTTADSSSLGSLAYHDDVEEGIDNSMRRRTGGASRSSSSSKQLPARRENLWGREKQQESLRNLVKKVLRTSSSKESSETFTAETSGVSSSQTVFIHGPSGCGKTSLCLDLDLPENCHFLLGKFDQYNDHSSPCMALVQAFDCLLETSDVMSDQRDSSTSNIRERIEVSLNHNEAGMLVKLVPSFAKLSARSRGSAPATNRVDMNEQQESTKSRLDATSISMMNSSSTKVVGVTEKDADTMIDLDDDTTGSSSEHDSIASGGHSGASGELQLASERLTVAFVSFLQMFCSPENPVILVVDDLQWADLDSLNVLQAIIESQEINNLLVLGVYRDEEIDEKLDEFLQCALNNNSSNSNGNSNSNSNRVHDLPISNLSYDQTTSLILEFLSLESTELDGTEADDKTKELIDHIYRKTHGNPFFSIQFLLMLQRNNLLKFDYARMKWRWDISFIKQKTGGVADNVAAVLTHRVHLVSDTMLKVLQLASCLGFAFDSELLEHLAQTTDPKAVPASFKELLAGAVSENFIEEYGGGGGGGGGSGRSSTAYYRFSHDRIHQAVYETIRSKKEREEIHWMIGKKIESMISTKMNNNHQDKKSKLLFLCTDQLNRGSSCLSSSNNAEEERRSLIKLNHEASKAAKKRNGIDLIGMFLEEGMKLVREMDWTTHYELIIDMYGNLADYEASRGRFESGIEYVDEIVKRAKDPTDTIAALATKSQIYYSQMKYTASVEICRKVLCLCGERLPAANIFMVIIELQRTKALIKGTSDDDLLNLPKMTDRKQIIALRTLLIASVCGWALNPLLLVVSYLRMFRITIKYGQSRYTGTAFANFACILAEMDLPLAVRFADLALKVQGDKITVASSSMAVYAAILYTKLPLASLLEPCLAAYRQGLECGDTIFGPACIGLYCHSYLAAGLRLDTFAMDMQKFCSQLKIMRHYFQLGFLSPNMQLAFNLTGRSSDPVRITWEIITQQHGFYNEDSNPGENPMEKICIYHTQLFNAYIMRDLEVAEMTFKELYQELPREKDRKFGGSHFANLFFALVDGMVGLWLEKMTGKRKYRRIVDKAIKFLSKNPNLNNVPLQLWLEAQKASFSLAGGGSRSSSIDDTKEMYDKVIAMFVRSGMVHYGAMACEQIGESLINRNGDDDPNQEAIQYLERSLDLYMQWAAFAKVDSMKKSYNFLQQSAWKKKRDLTSRSSIRGREQYSSKLDSAASERSSHLME